MKKKIKKKRQDQQAGIAAPGAAVAPQPVSLAWLALILLVIAALAASAQYRNRIYKTPVTLWADNAAKSPNKRRTHENYGQALSTAGMYNEAIAQFKTVLALPDDSSVPLRDLYREIGVVYYRVGMIDDAIQSWQTGLRHSPYDPSLLNNLSVAYMRQNRLDEAEVAIRQALVGSPYMPYALNSLGEILMMRGRYEEALKSFLQAIQLSPETAARYWNAALAFEKTGRYDMAYQYASKYAAMETSPALQKRATDYIERLKSLYFSKKQ